ncbi:MAG: TM1266 family iron-only hydrogenase system putative regulator [Bacillota bacterium]|jgi:putative iron-only hydrogenase system regulator
MSAETRTVLLGIVVEDVSSAESINKILHDYRQYVIGRMGLPYADKGISIISVVLDAPQNEISAVSGKIGMLPGVSAKAVYAKSAGSS